MGLINPSGPQKAPGTVRLPMKRSLTNYLEAGHLPAAREQRPAEDNLVFNLGDLRRVGLELTPVAGEDALELRDLRGQSRAGPSQQGY